MGVLLGGHVPGFFEQRKIDKRRGVALGARIAIPIPRTAEVTALLDDPHIVDAGLLQRRARNEARKASADEDHLDVIEEWLAVHDLDVGVIDIVSELILHLDVLIVAVRSQALVAFG